MKRFALALGTAAALLLPTVVSGAQSAGKAHRIGFLAIGGAMTSPQIGEFRQGLRELGRIEGQNIELELRWAEGQFERLPELAAELVQWKPDVLVTVAPQGYQAVRGATRTIPVVIIACDPVESIVQNISRPAGNVTGVTCMASDITPKRLQLLKEAVPRVRRIAVLYNPFDPDKAVEVQQMHEPARRIGVTLLPVEARDGAAVDAAIAGAARDGADALFVLNDPLMFQQRKRIADLAAKHALPAMYAFSEYVDAGGLMSYGTMQGDLFRRAAVHVDKVLRGGRPIDIPVEQASLFEMVVNLRAAKALGLAIPHSILLRADRVIE